MGVAWSVCSGAFSASLQSDQAAPIDLHRVLFSSVLDHLQACLGVQAVAAHGYI